MGRGEPSSVVVVDPDPQIRDGVCALLGGAGISALGYESAEEALAHLHSDDPALVLCEVELPGITGYELLRAIHHRDGTAIPVIFVTGARTATIDRAGGLIMGADDYVVKPFDGGELVARVRRSLARSELASQPVAGLHGLTARERDVLCLLADGMTQGEIALELVISPRTVSTHIQRILIKLGVHSRAQAVAVAHREGMAGVRGAA